MLNLAGVTDAVIPGVTTVSVSVFDALGASVPFPPYEAVMLYTPVSGNDVWRAAFPLASNVTVPSVVVAYEKITCPVGTAPEDWVTLAVSVTLSPVPAVVFDDVSVVVVGNCKGKVISGTTTWGVGGNCSESATVKVTM